MKTLFSGDFIKDVARLTPVVHLQLRHTSSLPADYKGYWESCAKEMTSTGENEKVFIHVFDNRSNFYREPWFEFMDTFIDYF